MRYILSLRCINLYAEYSFYDGKFMGSHAKIDKLA